MISPELLALQEVVAGRYSIVRELGRGGMGIVFLAREAALERPVAIKMLPPALAELGPHRARFVREAKTAAGLAHPNIVPIHAVEEHEHVVFFVMGFIDGETLAERVARAGPLSTPEVIRLVQEVAWALGLAHASGVVHRDVKPENILLERGSGRAVVTDFGIAWHENTVTTTGGGTIVGTPRYMSPEQATGETVDGRSDVYALGAVAYFASTGRPPIDGPTTPAILTKLVSEAPPSLAHARRDLPPRFVAAIDRCLAKDPAARWPSAVTLAAAMGSVGGTSVEIAPPVRAFLRDANTSGAELATALTMAGASLVMLFVTLTLTRGNDFGAGLSRAFNMVLYLGSAASMAGIAAWRCWQFIEQARRLIKSGYGHSAVRAALTSDEESHHQEVPSIQKTIVGTLAGIAATGVAIWLSDMGNAVPALIGIGGSIVAPTMTVRLWLRRAQTRERWWTRLVRGAFGRTVFGVASTGLDPTRVALPAAGELTSLALGHAVGDLFDALPVDQRARFSNLPPLVSRLEQYAEELRRRPPHPETDTRSATVVAALEALRLDLLRLHAAAGSPDDLTRDLDAAARIGDEIAAQLEAKAAADRVVQGDFRLTADG